MNYYTQGDKKNGEKIKKAFERLGIDTEDWSFINDKDLYFNVGNKIHTIEYEIGFIVTNKPDYEQLPLPDPDFAIGDWLIVDAGDIYRLKGISDTRYELVDTHMKTFSVPFSLDCSLRKWTIEDAKNGDVLAANEVIVLFKEIDGLNIRTHFSYHYMNTPMVFTNELHNKMAFRPALDSEREKLFRKIAEEGYTWDSENKRLCNLQDMKNFEPGTVLTSTGDSTIEILKKLSDGYIVLRYSDSHKVYDTEFIKFEHLIEFNYTVTDLEWEKDLFIGENIKENPGWSDSYIPNCYYA
jgi:hypothetical protein